MIGTSTNLVGLGFLPSVNERNFDFFETGYLGLPIAAVIIIFIVIFGPCCLPRNKGGLFRYAVQRGSEFLSEVNVEKKSKLIGKRADTSQSSWAFHKLN